MAGSGSGPPLSSISTRSPCPVSASAVAVPTGPEPMTQTSAAKLRRASSDGRSRIMAWLWNS